MIEVILVRHAEPDWEPGGRAVDHPQLSERGRRQAGLLADFLAKEAFDAGAEILKQKAEAGGDAEAIERLKKLGYL